MRVVKLVLSGALLLPLALVAAEPLRPPEAAGEKVGGAVGARLDFALAKGVKEIDAKALAAVFAKHEETWRWQTEFWGKWMHSAVPLWQRTGDAALKAAIDASVKDVLAAQSSDGYIGNYAPEWRNKNWDIWGQKYTLLGLLIYQGATGDAAALAGARRLADHLIQVLRQAGKPIQHTGRHHGLASGSILEPIVMLYRATKDPKYLAFAREIVRGIGDAPDGPQLVTKALAGIAVGDYTPYQTADIDGSGLKAYEMMSCYQGLIDYARVTGERNGLDAAIAAAGSIRRTEINIAGAGTSGECWCGGGTHETEPFRTAMETCVLTTWMRLCGTLLEATRDPAYADDVERTFYNAYLAALARDTGRFQMYGSLAGPRHRGVGQCGMDINCCAANGPRGAGVFLRDLALADADALFVNFYAPSETALTLGGGARVVLAQTTDYPHDGKVRIEVRPAAETTFTLNLRIPAWSRKTTVRVNGADAGTAAPGKYFAVRRAWRTGDAVELAFDMTPVAHVKDHHLAFTRGPVVFARDARFNDGNIHEVVWPIDGTPAFQPVADHDAAFDQVWALKMDTGLYKDWPVTKTVRFCDFASAGDTWDDASVLRVWLPLPLR